MFITLDSVNKDIKKAWNPTIAVPRFEAFALPR